MQQLNGALRYQQPMRTGSLRVGKVPRGTVSRERNIQTFCLPRMRCVRTVAWTGQGSECQEAPLTTLVMTTDSAPSTLTPISGPMEALCFVNLNIFGPRCFHTITVLVFMLSRCAGSAHSFINRRRTPLRIPLWISKMIATLYSLLKKSHTHQEWLGHDQHLATSKISRVHIQHTSRISI